MAKKIYAIIAALLLTSVAMSICVQAVQYKPLQKQQTYQNTDDYQKFVGIWTPKDAPDVEMKAFLIFYPNSMFRSYNLNYPEEVHKGTWTIHNHQLIVSITSPSVYTSIIDYEFLSDDTLKLTDPSYGQSITLRLVQKNTIITPQLQ